MSKILAVGLLLATLTDEVPNPVTWSFKQAAQRPLSRGETLNLRLYADIQPGWHLYSIDQPPGGPMATEISMAPGQPFAFAGPIVAPKSHVIFDQSFGMRVRLYTERALFTVPVKVAANAPTGAQTLVIDVRYQSCNDTLCLPPRTIKLSVAVQIRER
jgi:DsbC/DsbD-like thiol-disulfide interchange protein